MSFVSHGDAADGTVHTRDREDDGLARDAKHGATSVGLWILLIYDAEHVGRLWVSAGVEKRDVTSDVAIKISHKEFRCPEKLDAGAWSLERGDGGGTVW